MSKKSKINLIDYECIPTDKEYIALKKYYFKMLVAPVQKLKNSREAKAIFLTGPPASGKSTYSKTFKNYVNLDKDTIINEHPNMKRLRSRNVIPSYVLESCSTVADRIIDDISQYCVSNRINFVEHMIYGASIDFLLHLKNSGYTITTYYLYSTKSYKRNKSRVNYSFNKKIYHLILKDMSPNTMFTLFVSSDKFAFIDTSQPLNKYKQDVITGRPGTWLLVRKKIDTIITKVKRAS